jgi:hypothetical protein
MQRARLSTGRACHSTRALIVHPGCQPVQTPALGGVKQSSPKAQEGCADKIVAPTCCGVVIFVFVSGGIWRGGDTDTYHEAMM